MLGLGNLDAARMGCPTPLSCRSSQIPFASTGPCSSRSHMAVHNRVLLGKVWHAHALIEPHVQMLYHKSNIPYRSTSSRLHYHRALLKTLNAYLDLHLSDIACHAQAQRAETVLRAAVAERPGVVTNPYIQPSGKGLGFYTGEDGYLYVDNLRIDDIRAEVCVALRMSRPRAVQSVYNVSQVDVMTKVLLSDV